MRCFSASGEVSLGRERPGVFLEWGSLLRKTKPGQKGFLPTSGQEYVTELRAGGMGLGVCIKNKYAQNVGENVGRREHLYTVGGDVN